MEKSEYQEVKKAVMLVSAAIAITVLTIILTRSDALQKPVKPVISAQTAGASAGDWREISGIRQGNDEFTAVAVDDQNRIYAGMKSSKDGSFYIAVFASDGKLLETIPVDAKASSLAATADGAIYAASENQISVISPVSGSRQIKKWQPLADKAILTSLAADDKHVFAADAGNRLVYVYDRDGRLTNTVKELTALPYPVPVSMWLPTAAAGSGRRIPDGINWRTTPRTADLLPCGRPKRTMVFLDAAIRRTFN